MSEQSTLFKVKRALALYQLVGSFFFLILMFYKLGVLGFFNSLFPSLFFVLLLIFFIYSGYKGFVSQQGDSFYLLRWTFFIQAIHIKILGLQFENFFGPYLGVGFSDEPTIRFVGDFKLFWYHFINGYNQNSFEIRVVVNLISIGLGIILSIKEKRSEPQILQ